MVLPLPFIESFLRSGVTPSSLQSRFEDEDTELLRQLPLLQRRHVGPGRCGPMPQVDPL